MLVGWLALLAQPAVAQVTYEGSFAGLTGYYLFTERTNSLIFTNGLRWRSGRLSLSANLPLWYQNTTLVSSSGGGTVPTGGPEGQGAVRDSGQANGQPGGGGRPAVLGDPSSGSSCRAPIRPGQHPGPGRCGHRVSAHAGRPAGAGDRQSHPGGPRDGVRHRHGQGPLRLHGHDRNGRVGLRRAGLRPLADGQPVDAGAGRVLLVSR